MKLLFSLLSVFALIQSVQAQVISLGQVVYPTVTIAMGSQASSIIMTSGLSLVGCELPASFTGTSISFVAATSMGGTYQPLYNSSGLVSYTVAQGEFIAIHPEDFYGVQFFKIVSGSSEAGARSFICSMKGI